MIKSAFGVAEGATEMATDRFVSGSPETIRAQFRKTKEDWTRDFNQMRNAVAELIRIREMKTDEVRKLDKESTELEQKMAGAIELYKKNPDPRYREAYAALAARNEQLEARMKELEGEIEEQKKQIETYKSRLGEFQQQIENLSKEEAETVADIVSSQRIRELNDRLSGLSVDTQSKNLEAIRAARQKAKAVAKLSTEMAGTDKKDFEKELAAAGAASKYLDAFDSATGKRQNITAQENEPAALPSPMVNTSPVSRDQVAIDVENLLANDRSGGSSRR
jgi:phage shock protein A